MRLRSSTDDPPATLPRAAVELDRWNPLDDAIPDHWRAPIVSISDIHGYLDDARSALTAVGETDRFDPVVTQDEDGTLHWAGNDYVLVFNGDMVDRGDRNEETLAMVQRLLDEAPRGRVRFHLGNHEMAILLPEVLYWPETYSGRLDDESRESFLEWVDAGLVTAAFKGHEYTYSHAGSPSAIDVSAANETLRAAAADLRDAIEDGEYIEVQEEIPERYPTVFGLDGGTGRGPGAGLLWMDFKHMPTDTPAQVVGHTKHRAPTRRGQAVCGNVIRQNRKEHGGEGVLVETQDALLSVTRLSTGAVSVESV
ncbi:metallophosphoesterase [Haloarchaeobius sp. HME9146]|uniref:metallophosphoesterase n=1 Tax=Haloarchaeobius sp. HME9146 TaxID=2978732 RepID=UPI0021C11348|nr:metallophosphoesterase [Haloarchaeobius sp. HME9146]MCT9098095.1 metallophosphoesterase [Haloarchaeobius sp. HME9146]